ncbi:MAG: XdhC family protein [Acidobacteriota bacterium]
MRAETLQLAADLTRKGEPFVLAVVVRREPPSSAQVGNTAVITESGDCHGWLGGSCIHETVVHEAVVALRNASPRLISLTPDPHADRRAGVDAFPMTCYSGGTVDIYLEPVMPAPRLLVFGISPSARAVVRLGKVMGYSITVVDPDATRDDFPDADRVATKLPLEELATPPRPQHGRLFVVVATLGQHDEDAALAALALEPAYLGVVASRKRFGQIRATLADRGASAAALDSIVNPAGIDIGAKTPEEVALSILAEIVRVRQTASERSASDAPAATPAQDERDLVCGMTVAVATARHRAEHAGRTYYFCSGGCRERFVAAPDRYVAAVAR